MTLEACSWVHTHKEMASVDLGAICIPVITAALVTIARLCDQYRYLYQLFFSQQKKKKNT